MHSNYTYTYTVTLQNEKKGLLCITFFGSFHLFFSPTRALIHLQIGCFYKKKRKKKRTTKLEEAGGGGSGHLSQSQLGSD